MTVIAMTVSGTEAARKPLTKQRHYTRYDCAPGDDINVGTHGGDRCEERFSPTASQGQRFIVGVSFYFKSPPDGYVPVPGSTWEHPFQWHSPGGGNGGPPMVLSAIADGQKWFTKLRGNAASGTGTQTYVNGQVGNLTWAFDRREDWILDILWHLSAGEFIFRRGLDGATPVEVFRRSGISNMYSGDGTTGYYPKKGCYRTDFNQTCITWSSDLMRSDAGSQQAAYAELGAWFKTLALTPFADTLPGGTPPPDPGIVIYGNPARPADAAVGWSESSAPGEKGLNFATDTGKALPSIKFRADGNGDGAAAGKNALVRGFYFRTDTGAQVGEFGTQVTIPAFSGEAVYESIMPSPPDPPDGVTIGMRLETDGDSRVYRLMKVDVVGSGEGRFKAGAVAFPVTGETTNDSRYMMWTEAQDVTSVVLPKIGSLVESFDSNSIPAQTWSASARAIATGGLLHLPLPSGGGVQTWIVTQVNYDLRGSSFAVQLVNAGDQTQNTVVQIGVSGGTSGPFWEITGNSARVCRTIAGVTSVLTSFTYDPTTHVSFRVRADSDNVYWETSVDAMTWTPRHTINATEATWPVNGQKYWLWAGTGAGNTTPTEVLFDNVNIALITTPGGTGGGGGGEGEIYVPTAWHDNAPPPLSATNLNKIEVELADQHADTGLVYSPTAWRDDRAPAITEAGPLNNLEDGVERVAAALGLSYTKTIWGGGWTPPRSASAFNRLEAQLADNRAEMPASSPPPPDPSAVFPSIVDADTKTGAVNADATTHNVVIPTNLATGNMILIALTVDGNPTISGWPTGWLQPVGGGEDTGFGNQIRHALRYFICDGTQANFALTTSVAERLAWVTYRIIDADQVKAPEVSGKATGSDAAPNPGGLGPSWLGKTLWLAFCHHDQGLSSRDLTAAPTAYTDLLNLQTGNAAGTGLGLARRSIETDIEDPDAFTMAGSDGWGARLIAIPPVGAT